MIDLGSVTALWYNKAEVLLREVDGVDIEDPDHTTDSAYLRAQKATVNRTLLELSDILALMSLLVKNEHHYMKGRGVEITVEIT